MHILEEIREAANYSRANGKPAMFDRVLTPDDALEILTVNYHDDRTGGRNRRLSADRVRTYAREMASGLWSDAVRTPIHFLANGQLVNGQHRVSALFEAGVSLPFTIVVGIAESDVPKIDDGRRHSSSDALRFRGITNSNQKAAIAANLMRWARRTRGSASTAFTGLRWTNTEVVDWVLDHEGILTAAVHTGVVVTYRIPTLNLNAIGTAYLIILSGGAPVAEVDAFFAALQTGVGLREDSPAYVLRERFFAAAKRRDGGVGTWDQVFLTIKGWNAHRTGKTIRLIAYRSDEVVPEPVG